ncbi:hypothetical protein Scep_025221 [Stephania cephalantha]|uniref:Uncharacterized protein n=1 Tax=Stephania cephalantha TaxID=152367 RepID=A0AAP0EN36_9MAGN
MTLKGCDNALRFLSKRLVMTHHQIRLDSTRYRIGGPGLTVSFRKTVGRHETEELDPFSLVADELSILADRLRAMVVAEVFD